LARLFASTRVVSLLVLLSSLVANVQIHPAFASGGPEGADASALGFVLPWDASDRWMCSQGNDGITHQDNAFYGFDFWRPKIEGAPVLAAADGRVVKVVNVFVASTWPNKPYTSGNVVILDHGGGIYTQYAHLKQEGQPSTSSNPYVKVGQEVKRGQRIASVGNTGSSAGAHLHFQVQNGPNEGSMSLPLKFLDVPGGVPQTGGWYKPLALLTDKVPPKAGDLKQPANGSATAFRGVTFRWGAGVDDQSGVSHYLIRASIARDVAGEPTKNWIFEHSTEKDADPFATSFTFKFDRDYSAVYWTVIPVDYAGNQGPVKLGEFAIDTISPWGMIKIADGTQTTNQQVQLELNAEDNGKVSQMIIANRLDFADGTWEPYANTKSWQLTSGQGEKAVYVKYRDAAGNESPPYTANIRLNAEDLGIALDRHLMGLLRGLATLFTASSAVRAPIGLPTRNG